jgi:hypothetical protein
MITDREENGFFYMENLSLRKKVEVVERKDRMMEPGKLSLKVILKNDSYKGFDKTVLIDLTILREAPLRQTPAYSEEDISTSK